MTSGNVRKVKVMWRTDGGCIDLIPGGLTWNLMSLAHLTIDRRPNDKLKTEHGLSHTI